MNPADFECSNCKRLSVKDPAGVTWSISHEATNLKDCQHPDAKTENTRRQHFRDAVGLKLHPFWYPAFERSVSQQPARSPAEPPAPAKTRAAKVRKGASKDNAIDSSSCNGATSTARPSEHPSSLHQPGRSIPPRPEGFPTFSLPPSGHPIPPRPESYLASARLDNTTQTSLLPQLRPPPQAQPDRTRVMSMDFIVGQSQQSTAASPEERLPTPPHQLRREPGLGLGTAVPETSHSIVGVWENSERVHRSTSPSQSLNVPTSPTQPCTQMPPSEPSPDDSLVGTESPPAKRRRIENGQYSTEPLRPRLNLNVANRLVGSHLGGLHSMRDRG